MEGAGRSQLFVVFYTDCTRFATLDVLLVQRHEHRLHALAAVGSTERLPRPDVAVAHRLAERRRRVVTGSPQAGQSSVSVIAHGYDVGDQLPAAQQKSCVT